LDIDTEATPRIIIDLDGTLAEESSGAYPDREPKVEVVLKLREYASLGYHIVIHTSRSMRTYQGQVGLINLHSLPVILQWLDQHEIPCHEVVVGKPWCGPRGFYVDDRALRPDEFAALTVEEASELLGDK